MQKHCRIAIAVGNHIRAHHIPQICIIQRRQSTEVENSLEIQIWSNLNNQTIWIFVYWILPRCCILVPKTDAFGVERLKKRYQDADLAKSSAASFRKRNASVV